MEEQLQTTRQQLKQRDAAIRSTLELCQTLELKLDQMSHQFVGKKQFQALQQQYDLQQQELQLQQQETKVVIMELMNELQMADQTNQQLRHELTASTQQEQSQDLQSQNHFDTHVDIDTHIDNHIDTHIDTHAIIQAGIDLADSLIELLLEGNEQSEDSVLEQMEALDQLLGNDDDDNDENYDDDCQYQQQQGEYDNDYSLEQMRSTESSFCLLGEQIIEDATLTLLDTTDNKDNDYNENMIWRLYHQVQQLEHERSMWFQESLDMLEATRAANEIELQVKLTEMQEETNQTIQLRVMEELQKHRTMTVVDEDDVASVESKSTT